MHFKLYYARLANEVAIETENGLITARNVEVKVPLVSAWDEEHQPRFYLKGEYSEIIKTPDKLIIK